MGYHYYSPGEKITWEDTFADESNDIRNRIYQLDINVEWAWAKFKFAMSVVLDMMAGFLDQGRSFEKGFKILEDEFMLSQILSFQTIQFLFHEREAMMIQYDIFLAYAIAKDHFEERWAHLRANINYFDFFSHYI